MLGHAALLAGKTLNPTMVAWLLIAKTYRMCVAGIIPSYLRSVFNFLFLYGDVPAAGHVGIGIMHHVCFLKWGNVDELHLNCKVYEIYDLI